MGLSRRATHSGTRTSTQLLCCMVRRGLVCRSMAWRGVEWYSGHVPPSLDSAALRGFASCCTLHSAMPSRRARAGHSGNACPGSTPVPLGPEDLLQGPRATLVDPPRPATPWGRPGAANAACSSVPFAPRSSFSPNITSRRPVLFFSASRPDSQCSPGGRPAPSHSPSLRPCSVPLRSAAPPIRRVKPPPAFAQWQGRPLPTFTSQSQSPAPSPRPSPPITAGVIGSLMVYPCKLFRIPARLDAPRTTRCYPLPCRAGTLPYSMVL